MNTRGTETGCGLTDSVAYPDDWQSCPLGEVGKWYSGGTPSMSNAAYWNGDIPWVSAKDMKVSRLRDSEDHISKKAVADGARLIPIGSVLMVIRGMILAHTFPVARVEKPLAFNQDLKAVVAGDGIDSNFLLFWLLANTQHFLGLTTESTHGTKRLPPETLFRVPFPLPTKAEQEAIAGALSDADALIESLEQLVAKKRQIKHGAMQELLTGRRRLTGFTKSTAYKQSEIGVIPEDWDVIPLGKLVRSVEYGSSAKSDESGAIPVLRMGNLQSGKIDWSNLVYTDDAAEISKYTLRAGDILFNRTNTIDLVGKTSIYEGERPAIFAGYLIRINVATELLNPRFLNYTLNTELGRKHSAKVLSVAVGQANINGQKVKTYPIPLPPTLLEQEAIAAVLSDMDAEIAALEANLSKARQVKQGMMQELLTGRIRLI